VPLLSKKKIAKKKNTPYKGRRRPCSKAVLSIHGGKAPPHGADFLVKLPKAQKTEGKGKRRKGKNGGCEDSTRKSHQTFAGIKLKKGINKEPRTFFLRS